MTRAHIKPNLLGHWGTTPGQNFIYVHLNRVIKLFDLNMFYISGPGHGGPAIVGKPIIFAFHGYPSLIHELTYRRTNHHNMHVRGYKEEGTITTTFDMTVLNDLDRFHLVMDTIDRVPKSRVEGAELKQKLIDKLVEHKKYIDREGQDMTEIRNWKWNNSV